MLLSYRNYPFIPKTIRHLTTGEKMTINELCQIFTAGVDAVKPDTLIKSQVKLENDQLIIRDKSFTIRQPCYMVGFGKAAYGMATAMESILQDRLRNGIIMVPSGTLEKFGQPYRSCLEFISGAKNNRPDNDAYLGAEKIKEYVEKLEPSDTLIVLISGGGSALLPYPKPPLTLIEKIKFIESLQKAGANIMELNTVRRRLSVLKGGGLLRCARNARVITLILKDVVGDDAYVASGPTFTFNDFQSSAMEILDKYRGIHVPKSVIELLEAPLEPPIESYHFNIIIGNNRMAAEAAQKKALSMGIRHAYIVSTDISMPHEPLRTYYASFINAYIEHRPLDLIKRIPGADDQAVTQIINLDRCESHCLIFGGEPTLEVTGKGRGGRSQQLILEVIMSINTEKIGMYDLGFIFAGTDGADGPTDAAGAIGTMGLLKKIVEDDMDVKTYIETNNSYTFFYNYQAGIYHFKSGLTGTNVMDLHIFLFKPPNQSRGGESDVSVPIKRRADM